MRAKSRDNAAVVTQQTRLRYNPTHSLKHDILSHANSSAFTVISCGQRSGSEVRVRVSHGTEPQKIKGLPGASVIEFNTNMK